MSSSEPRSAPHRLATFSPGQIISSGLCIGCGACATMPGVRMDFDRYGQIKPRAENGWIDKRNASFSKICPFSPAALDEDELAAMLYPSAASQSDLLGRYESAYVGYVAEGDFREKGSSGGLVTWVAAELMQQGLVDGVAHVVPNESCGGEPLFHYVISRDINALRLGAKSRYYPVELSGVLDIVRETPGRYAIVGIPCFIKAVRLACNEDPVLKDRIGITIGLFCGHMKSARMTESFAMQMGVDLGEVERLDYRTKNPDRPANWYRAEFTMRDGTIRGQDWWHLVDGDWGAGFFQYSACNFCDDVVAETADISLGDAWVEPYSSDGRGTSVVIVRSRPLARLIQEAMAKSRLALSPVNEALVVATQAAGFRHRREGLAFRLQLPRTGLRPRKRVGRASGALRARRKLIFVMRSAISAWSHRIFWLARTLNAPRLYTVWARAALSSYHGLAYSRGILGRIADCLGLQDVE
jgi:coenzyme F420-reducing hydrogenase beta subunit